MQIHERQDGRKPEKINKGQRKMITETWKVKKG